MEEQKCVNYRNELTLLGQRQHHREEVQLQMNQRQESHLVHLLRYETRPNQSSD